MADPILKIGRFGTHIMKNPAGTFSFYGTVPTACDGRFTTEDEAMAAFIAFFKAQTAEWQRENVGNLRNDVFAKIFGSKVYTPIERAEIHHFIEAVAPACLTNRKSLLVELSLADCDAIQAAAARLRRQLVAVSQAGKVTSEAKREANRQNASKPRPNRRKKRTPNE